MIGNRPPPNDEAKDMSKLTRYFRARLQPLVAAYVYGADEKNSPVEEYTFAADSSDGEGKEVSNLLAKLPLPEKPVSEPSSLSGSIPEFREFLKSELRLEGVRQLESELRCTARYNPPAIVAQFHGGRVLHSCGAVIDCRNRLVSNMSGIVRDSELPGNPLQRGMLSTPKRCGGTVACLAGDSHQNVFHWYMDILPKLKLFEASGIEIDKYYVPTKYRHQRETLARLGINEDRIVHARAETHLECDSLIAASFEGGALNCFRVEAARELLRNQSSSFVQQKSKRIYISRRKARVRRIENESNVERVLRRFGFQKFYLEDMSIADQVSLFEVAEMVVAPHGAGLTNTCFCRAGTKVLELNTPVRISSLFARIASVCGLEYHLHIAKPSRIKHFNPGTALGDSNLVVEEGGLERAVRSILDGSRSGLHSCDQVIGPAQMRSAS